VLALFFTKRLHTNRKVIDFAGEYKCMVLP